MLIGRHMKRIFALSLVFLIAASLARDESWTTAGYAAMLNDLDKAGLEPLICDCNNPSPECQNLCDPFLSSAWTCGTGMEQKRQRLREALIRGDRPDVIEQILNKSPALVERLVYYTTASNN